MMHDIFSKNKSKTNFPKQKIMIDFREKNSLVPSKISKLGLEIELKELKVGDYLVNDTIIERKTSTDFIQSMINGRLKKQIEEIQQYPNYLLIIEGNFEDISKNKVHPNCIRGFLLSIVMHNKIPAIFTKNEEETAEYIKLISNKKRSESKINPTKKHLTQNELLEFILESFPKIGRKKSKKLLKKFKTLKNIFNSTEEKLDEILKKDSKEFLKILNTDYN